jgi:hypothetical protein
MITFSFFVDLAIKYVSVALRVTAGNLHLSGAVFSAELFLI